MVSRIKKSISIQPKKSKVLKKTVHSKKKSSSSTSSLKSSIKSFKNSMSTSFNSTDDMQINDNALQLLKIKSLTDKKPVKMSDKVSSKYYPSIRDENFHQEIINHPIFKKYVYPDSNVLFEKLFKTFSNNKDLKDEEKVEMDNIFKLTPSQKFLRNFMSPYTPYRGLFVIHGTGVGKTCTGLTIAEQLKDYVKDNNQRITIIRPDEFRRENF